MDIDCSILQAPDASWHQHQVDAVEKYMQLGLMPQQLNAPVYVLWELTDRCTLNCRFCYNSSGPSTKKELSFERAQDIAHELGKMKVFLVCLSGGDALLRKDFFNIASTLKSYNIVTNTILNGWLVTENIVKKIADTGMDTVQISVDGLNPSTHDYLRNRQKSWKRAINAIKMFRDQDINVIVGTVTTRQNVDEIPGLIDFLENLGVSKHIISPPIEVGRAATVNTLYAGFDAYKTLLNVVLEKRKSSNMNILFSPNIQYVLQNLRYRPVLGAVISGSGAARINPYLPFTYGDLHTQPFQNIWDKYLKNGHNRPETLNYLSSLEKEDSFLNMEHIAYLHDAVIS